MDNRNKSRNDYLLLMKGHEYDRPRAEFVSQLLMLSESGQPRWEHSTAYLSCPEMFAQVLSPRIGGHAFIAPAQDAPATNALIEQIVGRDVNTGYSLNSAALHGLPHRFAARIEIDGEGAAPSLAARSACQKLAILVDLMQRHSLLLIAPCQSRNPLQEFFAPFFSGNRSLHLLALGASPFGVQWASGIEAWCRRINIVASREGLCGRAGLVDPHPHCNVRSPWRAMFTPHEKTGLWANPLRWDLVLRADGDAIVDQCRKPVVEHWPAAAISAMGFDRPPDNRCAALYSSIRQFAEFERVAQLCAGSAKLPAIKSNRPRHGVDWFRALVDMELLGPFSTKSEAGYYQLGYCPGCHTRERGKCFATHIGWLKCWRASCSLSEGMRPLGPDGWFELLGLDAAEYGLEVNPEG